MIGGISPLSNWGSSYGYAAYTPLRQAASSEENEIRGLGMEDSEDKENEKGVDDRIAKMTGKKECQTCKNRKYVDGSDENVSFKTAAKINPAAVEARVRGHEQEHVTNAYEKAAQLKGGRVLSASVTLKYAICPECGRSYCAGGLTRTLIRSDKETPYDKNQNSFGREAALGNNIDEAV